MYYCLFIFSSTTGLSQSLTATWLLMKNPALHFLVITFPVGTAALNCSFGWLVFVYWFGLGFFLSLTEDGDMAQNFAIER